MIRIGKWPARAMYILVALALVLSMALAGLVPGMSGQDQVALADSAAGPGNPALLVYIERPYEDRQYVEGDIFYVNAVVAYKDIDGDGPSSVTVEAVIDTGDNAELVEGENASKSASIARNCLGDFWWEVRCTGEGETIITVTAAGDGMQGQDSVRIWQGPPPAVCELVIERIQPETDPHYVDVDDHYDVKVKVTNHSDKVATDVEVCIDIDPETGAVLTGDEPHCWDMGDIRPGRHVYVGWNLHCQNDSVVDITVSATADNVIVCPPATVEVRQGELPPEEIECLDVDVVAVQDGEEVDKVPTVGCDYNKYMVRATISNYCYDDCEDVEATLTWDPGDGVTLGVDETKTKEVGTIPGESSAEVTWDVTCLGLGPVTFTVRADGDCGWALDRTEVDQKKVLAKLVEPASGTLEQHNVCTTFNVTANITNGDCFALDDVEVKLQWPETVGLWEDPDDPSVYTRVYIRHFDQQGNLFDEWEVNAWDLPDPQSYTFPSFCACCIYEISWIDLHCKAPSAYPEEVWLQVFDKEGQLLDDDYFYLHQTEKAHLSTGVEVFPWTGPTSSPLDPAEESNAIATAGNPWWPVPSQMGTTPLEALAVGQQYMAVFPVMNTGQTTAHDVWVSINVTGQTDLAGVHDVYFGSIAGGTAKKAFTTMPFTCTGDGDVVIEIIEVTGIDAHTGEEIPEDNLFPCGYRRIKQIPIVIEIVQPYYGEEFTCLDFFDVKVRVANESGIEGHDLTGVTATITWDGPAQFHPQAPSGYETKALGDLEAGTEATVVWNMQCTDAGRVYFDVEIESADPAWSQTKTFYVDQVPYAQLYVEILSPMGGAWYGTGEEFAVTAKVWAASWLPGIEYVHDVEVTVSEYYYYYHDWLEVEGDRTITLEEPLKVGYDNAQVVSWTVRAVKSGTQCNTWGDYILVEAGGPCAGWAYYSKYITIYPAANLVVEISEVPHLVGAGDEFEIKGRVTNTGWSDATGVKLELAVAPEGSSYPLTGYTVDIGTLIGYGQHDVEDVGYKEFSVTMEFMPDWPMTFITISPAGYDECGWHREHYYWGWNWSTEANRPIADKFLHSASATVRMGDPEPPDPVSEFDIDLETGWSLISLPLIPDDTDIDVVLADIADDVIAVWYYDAAGAEWLWYQPGVAASKLETMEDGKAYWINMADVATLTIHGSEFPPPGELPPTYPVETGWNMVGFKSTFTDMTPYEYLLSMDGKYTVIFGCWGDEWSFFRPQNFDKQYLEPGRGYWIAFTEAGDIYA